jgi:hypothetical protein
VLDVVGSARAGTYLVHGTNALYSWEEWTGPEGEAPLRGESIQVVRPAGGIQRVLDTAPEDYWPAVRGAIRPDRLAVAYWTRGEGVSVLRVLDLGTLQDREVWATASTVSAPVWLEE